MPEVSDPHGSTLQCAQSIWTQLSKRCNFVQYRRYEALKDCWCCPFLYLPAAQCLCNSFQRDPMRSSLPVAMPRYFLCSLLAFHNGLQTELGIKLKASKHMEWKALQAPKLAER